MVDAEGIEQGKTSSRIGANVHGTTVVAQGAQHGVHIHAHDGGGGEGLQFLGGGEGLQLLAAEGGDLAVEGYFLGEERVGAQGGEPAAGHAKGA